MAEMESLYHSHGEAILRYLHRTFGAAAPADDLLQETFVHALANPDACTHAASPRAFLFGIARHVGLSAARRSKLTRRDLLHDLAAPDVENDHALQEMRAAIQTLPPKIRETLELRLRDELSYEEIAAVLEVPVGTVRSRLHTALRLLKEQLHPPEAQ
jgi:RNA polymerase sigma factor (sigma-70 family)